MIDWLKRADIDPMIDLGGTLVPIVLRRHATAKRLTLRLAPDGNEVRITLPQWARSREAIAFAYARRDWLTEQFAKVPIRVPPKSGDEVDYRGQKVRIIWDETARRKPLLEGGVLRMGGLQEGLDKRIQRWLEKQARTLCETDMTEFTKIAKLAPVPVGLSRAQRRWGSCSDKQRIRINWRLIQAPDFVRRSVVAHEVAHLVHFDHSPAFHALLDTIYDDDITRADQWLKENGRGLYASFG